ncbi:alpha-2-macroglobulin [uncultured Treponema sp.]|uniref:alpha-2-macroglobulin family protein n=1 Tax=uncultured Treponema sp. TaxID=162155 RepID=UPI0025D29E51|nr:MG2 domain-containing protein [uncultured Treponema sp.]
MKKILAVLLSAGFLTVVSCKNEKSSLQFQSDIPNSAPGLTILDTGERVFDAGNFFTPDYTPYEPESESVAGKVRLSSPKAKGAKAESIEPGLRNLSEYKTSYSTKKSDFKYPEITRMSGDENESKKSSKKDEPFTIVDFGPRGAIPAEVRFPSFYVLFSEPVVALSSLGEVITKSEIMTIEPEIKGVFRWNGTSLLSFDTTEAVNPMQVYTIRINDNVKSLSGKSLTGEKSFSTEAAPLKIIWSAPGYSKDKWVDKNDVPPQYSKELRVQFNYPVNADEISKISKITAGSKELSFSVKQEMIDTVTYFLDEEPPFNTHVLLSVTQTLSGKTNKTTAGFNTLAPFTYEYEYKMHSYGKYTNPVQLYFSHPVEKSSVLQSISAKSEKGENLAFTDENFEFSGCTVKIFGLPVTFHSKYALEINSNLKDIYGRNIEFSGDKLSIEIEVPGAESSANFTDSGVRMLESTFPHKMIFEYQNIVNGAYLLKTTENPYEVLDSTKASELVYSPENEGSRTELSVEPRDERIFEIVNLEDKLLGEKGWVDFYSAIKLPRKPTNWDSSTYYWNTNKTSIQVTNLGVTVRYSYNKIAAMVTNLSDGKAVEGAKVYAYEPSANLSIIKENAPWAVTDKNGLAVINLTEKNVKSVISGDYWDAPYIFVEKDDDKVIFEPENHSPWRSGIYSYSKVPNEIKAEARIFMFSDRGLYKPGETVSFRGIDRDQILGTFLPYEGDFTVTLKEDTWRDAKEFGKIEGKTTESGGFYGSFEIPEDIEPGFYKIEYKREPEGKTQLLSINVAYFERLKFQTEVSMPKTPVIAGEKVQAKLGASYLAGGALASAKYETNWFREPWYFTSDEPEFNQYKFGPSDKYESRNHIREDSGALDANGSASISCETSGNSIKGAAYRYRLSADITDVSNQQVTAVGTVLVHPASFYLGLSKPEMQSSFARKGEKLTFTYKLALPDGKAIANSVTAQALSGNAKKLNVKLTREEWNLVQQQGIDDIYSRYEKTDVTESEESINLSESGKITVTPKEPGYHKIQVATTDKQGRDVITEYEFFVTGSGKVSWYQDDATALKLTPDKNQYNPGETAHILLESSLPEGNYLITVEREGIFTEEVRHLDGSVHVIDIPVARNYVPVFYVSISSYSVRQGEPVHEYGKADLDKPKGYYGAAVLFVNPRVKSFSVKVENAKMSYRPGEEAEITLYATKGGKPLANAELTLLAVDRGVLDLIDYHVPDPISFFYNAGNFPLHVKGGDSRDYLMDPVTYEVKNLKGGDSSDDEKMEERSDFNPTAIFEPMLKTDENGKVSVKFNLPDTLTTYRITVFGVNGELLALQEDEIAVQNPINVQQVLPRQLRERDTSEVGVLLTNLDEKAHEVSVSLSLRENAKKEDESGLTLKDGKAFVDGTSEHKITVPGGANTVVYFDLAAVKAGLVTLEFTVKSEVLNERLVCPLKIEKPYVFETVTTTGQLEEKEASVTERVVIPSLTENADDRTDGTLAVTLDATRLGLLGDAVKYLFEYPFGCLEQQSSRILPLVIFEDYIDVFNLENEVTNIRKCVKSYFKDWKNCQHSDGGFGYWPTSSKSNLFVSSKIAHIYALALQRGYKEKDLAIDIDKLCNYIYAEANSLKKQAELHIQSDSEYERVALFYNDYCRAYNYYVLALNGKLVFDEQLASIIRREGQDIAAIALSGLASIAKDGAKSTLAKEAASKIRTYMRPQTRGVDITNPNAPKWAFAYNGDEAENLALTLQLFTLLDKDDQMNTKLIYSLLGNQRAGYWKNTANTARVLESIYTLIKTNNLDKTNLNATALFNKDELAKCDFKGAASKPVTVTLPFDSDKLKALPRNTELPLEISKKGRGSLYYTTTMRYTIPNELQNARDEGLGLVMQLYDNTTGEEIKMKQDNSLIELESGKTYKVKITLSSSYDRDFVALRAPVPSGAEILDATFITSPDDAETSSGSDEYSEDYDDYEGYFYGGDHYMSNQAIYNSEIQFFWDSFGKGKTTAEFKFRAVRRGVFPTPPVSAECMYESEVFGRTDGILYTIK